MTANCDAADVGFLPDAAVKQEGKRIRFPSVAMNWVLGKIWPLESATASLILRAIGGGMIRRFLLGFAPTMLVAAAYWVIVWWQAPTVEAARYTLLSNLALSVFYPLVIPFIAGALTSAVDPGQLIGRTVPARIFLGVLCAFALGSSAYILLEDSQEALATRVIEPIEFRSLEHRTYFFDLNQRLRRKTAVADVPECEDVPSGDSWATACYMRMEEQRLRPLAIALTKTMGPASWWQRLLSAQALVVASALFVSLVALHVKGRRNDTLLDALLVCLGLAILWIPFRVYSDWYIHFQTFATVGQYSTLGIGSVLALAALLVTYFRRAVGQPSKVFSVVVAGVGTVASVVAAFKPTLLGPVSTFVLSLRLGFLIIFEVAIILLLFVLAGPSLGVEE